jgi:hypothetical protein
MARKQVPREQSSSTNASADHSGDGWDQAKGGNYFDGLKYGAKNPMQVQTGRKGGRYVVFDRSPCGIDGLLEKRALAILNSSRRLTHTTIQPNLFRMNVEVVGKLTGAGLVAGTVSTETARSRLALWMCRISSVRLLRLLRLRTSPPVPLPTT